MQQPALHQSFNLLKEASEYELLASRRKRSVDRDCPTMDKEYLREHRNRDELGRRSLSPFVLTINEKRNRYL